MITLAADCLIFELPTGERIPCSADMACVELMGNTAELCDLSKEEYPHFICDSIYDALSYIMGNV